MEFTLNQDLYNNPLPDFLEVQAQVLHPSQHRFSLFYKDKTRHSDESEAPCPVQGSSGREVARLDPTGAWPWDLTGYFVSF